MTTTTTDTHKDGTYRDPRKPIQEHVRTYSLSDRGIPAMADKFTTHELLRVAHLEADAYRAMIGTGDEMADFLAEGRRMSAYRIRVAAGMIDGHDYNVPCSDCVACIRERQGLA